MHCRVWLTIQFGLKNPFDCEINIIQTFFYPSRDKEINEESMVKQTH